MRKFIIHTLVQTDLLEVSEFLARQKAGADDSPDEDVSPAVERIRQRLQWRIFDNPHRNSEAPAGHILRDTNGSIVGANMACPQYFLFGGERIFALCSGDFFVDPSARFYGLSLFSSYLNIPDVGFFFANSCNNVSGGLWKNLGGINIPYSEIEYVRPIRYGPLLSELLFRKTANAAFAGVGMLLGEVPAKLGIPRISRDFTAVSCCDWEKLAWLAESHRDPALVTCDRTADWLRWRYQARVGPLGKETYVFRDTRGREGWFAVGEEIRGIKHRIRVWSVLDAVVPRGDFDFAVLVRAVISSCADRADMIAFRVYPRRLEDLSGLGLLRRDIETPKTLLIGRTAAAREYARAAAFAPADGDAYL